jgi:hypothetical protein
MAIPTITTVSPNSGRTKGGNVILIVGTGFRVPTIPANGYVGGPAQQTVAVSFAGVRAAWAEAASGTQLYVRVPEWRGSASSNFPVLLDVRVANLSDGGTEIATENVTLSNGYSVNRPVLTGECTLQAVTRALLQSFKRHLLPNVGVTISRDYDDDPATVDRLRDSAPSIHLIGPRLALRRGVYHVPREDSAGAPLGPWTRNKYPVTVDLAYEIRGWTVNPFHSNNLVQQLLLLFRDLPWVQVGQARYEVEVDWNAHPDMAATPGYSDLEGFTAGLLIRGVHLDDDSATLVERGWSVTSNGGNPTLDVETR